VTLTTFCYIFSQMDVLFMKVLVISPLNFTLLIRFCQKQPRGQRNKMRRRGLDSRLGIGAGSELLWTGEEEDKYFGRTVRLLGS
jgi:hypothetical protein